MKLKYILVPVNSKAAVDELIPIACELSEKYKAEVLALYVIETPRTLPITADIASEKQLAEELLDYAEDVAIEKYGIDIATDILQARAAGPAIIEEAQERGADLILLNLRKKSTLERIFTTNTIDYILRRAQCRVWVNKSPT